MARTALTATNATRTGVVLNPTTAAITDGHSFANTGRRILVIKNANATVARTVEFPFGRTVDGQTIPPKSISVPAASTVVTDIWPAAYNQSDGSVWVNYPTITDLTVTVLEVSA